MTLIKVSTIDFAIVFKSDNYRARAIKKRDKNGTKNEAKKIKSDDFIGSNEQLKNYFAFWWKSIGSWKKG